VLLIIDPGRLTPENISNQPTFTGTVTFQSSLPSDEENILTTVDVTVTIQFIDYGLIVEPSIISVEFTRANLAPKEFVINVRNANPNYQGFVWSAEAPDAGVTVIPDHGSSAGDTMIRIDPASLSLSPPAEETEDGAQQIGRTGSYTVTFRSSLLPQDEDQGEVAATAQVTINVIVYDAQELTVSPSYLFFSVEALPAPEDGSITQPAPEPFTGTVEVQPGFPMVPEFVEQFLQISAGPRGWSASFDAPWLEVNALPGETDLDVFTDTTLSNEFPIGALRVKPLNSVLTQFGRYKSTIRIVDRASGFIREVPVIVEILRPGEESNVPVPPPEYIQNFPGFVLIEAADAHRVNLDLDLSTMEANERVYVLLEAPNLIPGITFAWTPYMPKVLQPVSINGNPVPGADQFFYSAGPIPEVPIKNLYLRGLAGRIMIRTQVGENLANSREMQRVQLNVSTPIGRWQITDRLAGESYTYDSEITHQIVAEPVDGYASTWGNTHVVVSYGDTRTHLYRIQFQQEGIGYIYDVISLTPNEMVGRWEFAGEGVGSGSQDFWGQRILSIR
jgi:hypothetical protein